MSPQLKAKIKKHYQLGQGSIQDLARVYRLSVEEVLDVLNLSELNTVEGIGDLIDQHEAGPEATLKATNTYRANYTLN